jgi:xeroderma pigmentosum group C-complementing protein
MSGFKDHPMYVNTLESADIRYVLERHLKREEVIQPKREIGRFRGEPVYRRQNVLSCKTAENWMRIGRKVKDRQEPLKWVKQRAVTIQKRRAQELAMQESGESIQQGLYAQHQTEVYIPPPIVDGKIPTNSFGNIDLYAPTMLPAGAVHLACMSRLEIYAELIGRQGHRESSQETQYQLCRGLCKSPAHGLAVKTKELIDRPVSNSRTNVLSR